MNATPPASVQYDLVVRNASLPDGRTAMNIAVRDGKIVAVTPQADLAAAHGATELDAQGQLVTPPFVDAHFHMDATLSYGLPRVNVSGTLLEGIALWGELKPLLTLKRSPTGRSLTATGRWARDCSPFARMSISAIRACSPSMRSSTCASA